MIFTITIHLLTDTADEVRDAVRGWTLSPGASVGACYGDPEEIFPAFVADNDGNLADPLDRVLNPAAPGPMAPDSR